jgi:sugar phosphate permease
MKDKIPAAEKPLKKGYKWELLILLCLAFFFHQGDRAIFGVVLPQIRTELNLTDSQLGMIGSVMFFTLACLMPFAGLIGDRCRKNWIITCSLIFWSSTTLFTGLTTGLIGLVMLRSVATAGGEAFYAPAAYSLLARFHHRTRAFAMSMHQAALYIGVMTSGFLGGWIADTWGWRTAFYAFGAAGLLLGVVFVFRLKDAPKEQVVAAPRGLNLFKGLTVIFATPSALLLTIGFTAIVFVNNAFVSWAPAMMLDKYSGLDLTRAGGYSMFVHHLPALIGVSIGGPLSDWWVLRRKTARLEMQALAMLLAVPAIYFMGMGNTLAATLCGIGVFGLFRGIYESNTHASLFEVIKPGHRSSAVAMMVMVAFLIGSLSPWYLGQTRMWWGDEHGLSYGFASLSIAYLIGAGAVALARFAFFSRDRVSDEEDPEPVS